LKIPLFFPKVRQKVETSLGLSCVSLLPLRERRYNPRLPLPSRYFVLPVGTAVHERTFPLCTSLNYREWSGFYAVSVYETHHEHEYNAIRNAAALIDVTPLFKYLISGRDATRFVNRVLARDINKIGVNQVIYCCWCDEEGKVIDDGTITRLQENTYRWTAADPNLRWFRQSAIGLEVQIEDITEQVAALALQGPTSGKLLQSVAEADISNLKYFRKTSGKIAGVQVDISRTGYTGDLGYEIWISWHEAVRVWDALMDTGRQFDIHPTGILALDVARIEAGLILADVDYVSSKKALIPSQKYSPYEIGLAKLVHLDKDNFIGKQALVRENKRRPDRGRGTVRRYWSTAANAGNSIARACPRVSGARAGGEGYFNDVVSPVEAVDRAGQCGACVREARHEVADGAYGGSGTAPRDCDRQAVAVLQSAAENKDASLTVELS